MTIVEYSAQYPVPRGRHVLPPLPYRYDALEPYISRKIVSIHHDTHHRAYVNGLNKAESNLAAARRESNFELVRHWERELAYNGSGHFLHTLYWLNMAPGPGRARPAGEVVEQIERDFGSLRGFMSHFTQAAVAVAGNGWTVLVWQAPFGRLEILQVERHENMAQWGTLPILIVDVWEHAYYLQYAANRAQYVEAWWNLVNWDDVGMRFQDARLTRLPPYGS